MNPECAGGYCIYTTTNSEPDGSGTWSWVSLAGNGAGWRQAPCYQTCDCMQPTLGAEAAKDAYGSGRFYAVDCSNGAILWVA